jgi:hypothetical protein
LFNLSPCVRRAIEKMKACRVAHRPAVEVAAPPIHLRRCDARRLADETREQPRLVRTGCPQRVGELVVAAKLPLGLRWRSNAWLFLPSMLSIGGLLAHPTP